MGIARQVYEFLKSASIAHAQWDYEVSMSIIRSRKRLMILGLMTLPILVVSIALAAGGDMLGGKQAFAPAFYSINIFLVSILIGLIAGLLPTERAQEAQ